MSGHVLIVGAGLAGSLTALALSQARSGTRVTLLERSPAATDSHTWSFHDPDISGDWHRRLDPALRTRWQGQEVRFPDLTRQLRAGYASLGSLGLAELIESAPGVEMLRGVDVGGLDASGATLADGRRIAADAVIDARGARPSRHLVTGWQKFLGLEIETAQPHGVTQPVIMDATVPQRDGYRFVYLLPFTPTRLLIEDTRYADGPALDEDALAQEVRAYANAHGWTGTEIRRERGVLPIALAMDARALWEDAEGGPVPVGLRGGFFHPVTGYSLPVAVQVADLIAATQPLTTDALHAALSRFAIGRARQDRFLRLLNRMLFRGCAPDRRWRVLQRFYRLPEPLIERFYAGRLTTLDRLAIVTGKPPIPLRDALPCLREAPLLKEQQ